MQHCGMAQMLAVVGLLASPIPRPQLAPHDRAVNGEIACALATTFLSRYFRSIKTSPSASCGQPYRSRVSEAKEVANLHGKRSVT